MQVAADTDRQTIRNIVILVLGLLVLEIGLGVLAFSLG